MSQSISRLVSNAIRQGVQGFDHFEVQGERSNGHCQYEPASDAEAEYWAVYGRIPGVGKWSIYEFPTREQAEKYRATLVDQRFGRKS